MYEYINAISMYSDLLIPLSWYYIVCGLRSADTPPWVFYYLWSKVS